MLNSPQRVPPSRRSSSQHSGGQLLDELEALSQALYQAQAQQKAFPDQHGDAQLQGQEKDSTSPSPKKPLSRRETLPARRFSSYEPSKDAPAATLPGLASSLDPPVSSGYPVMRHSMSTAQIPATFDQKPAAINTRPRFTSSTLPSQPLPSWGEEKSDIRTRLDRRASPQLQQIQSPDTFASEEFDWPDDAPDFNSKMEFSSGDKKKSFWNWKPLRALSHIGRQRFYCVFSAYVHAIKGLPSAMNGLRLCVHMRKVETKEGAVQTMPSRVFQGVAEFEETLFMKCTVYGSKGQSNTMKFMSKAFFVSVVAPDVEELDLGKHQLDLSRLLPDTMDEKKGELEKGNSWNTSLDLSGKAKGGKLAITFNYEVLDKDLARSSGLASKFQGLSHRRSSMQTSYSLPNSAHGTPRTRTANAYSNHSPSVSEPGNDFSDDLAMDHLNLDEPSSLEAAREVRGKQSAEVQHYPVVSSQFGMPAASSQNAFNALDNSEPRLRSSSQTDQDLAPSTPGQSAENDNVESDIGDAEPEDDASENEQDFMVVDQGMEIDEAVKAYRIKEEVREEEPGDHMEEEPESVKSSQPESVEGNMEAGKGVHDGETATMDLQDGEKKETVTYQMVMKTLESLLQGTTAKEQAHLEILEGMPEMEEKLGKSGHAAHKQVKNTENAEGKSKGVDTIGTKSHKSGMVETKQKVFDDNLDQEVDLVAGEFLHMLESGDSHSGRNSDSEPDSPRARLLKQFEQEALLGGGFGLDLSLPNIPEPLLENASVDAGLGSAYGRSSSSPSKRPGAASATNKMSMGRTHKDKETSSMIGAAESKSQTAAQNMQSNSKGTKSKMLEDAETKVLMQEWGPKEKALPKNASKKQEPEPLGRGLGATITVKDGGTLRSMSPSHFQSEKCSGKLVMQVSRPIVLPAEMGSGTVDVIRNMASIGIENMALQAMTAMPLEELIGMSIEQIAMEGLAAAKSARIRGGLRASFRLKPITKEPIKTSQQLGLLTSENKDAFISLENLAPMAMQQIEDLAMDGLKIQAGMTEEDAPYALNAFSIVGQGGGEDVSRQGNTSTLKGVTGVHLLKGAKVPAQTAGGGKGLMDMAITLDEWMLLDAGLYNEAENSKDTLAIMAAHHGESKRLDPNRKGARWGCMGNTLTISMLVQLRDPLRSNEAIGVPMIVFVQAERVMIPTEGKSSGAGEADSQPEPQFKITGVHMAGLKASQDNRRPGWGSQRQLRAATRWLLANGMSKPKAATSSVSGKSKVKQGESLWSISAQLLGSGNKWKDLMKQNPHIRNPDVIYENQSSRAK